MTTDFDPALLQRCAEGMTDGRLADADMQSLRHWWKPQRERAAELVELFAGLPIEAWSDAILAHRSHRHPWYDWLATKVTLREFAAFMLENRYFPSFLLLVERVKEAQICDVARAALQRNIDDERLPVPHADLMRRLMLALKAKAGDGLVLDSYPSLADRTLILYYGYYCDPWCLVGALFMIETMALHRMQKMNEGLRRLGLNEHELEFVSIHLTCDEHHAREWSECVIQPSVELEPQRRVAIAEGIAVALETMDRYLDDLVTRAASQRAAATTV
ncbi:iron-containing redox enzyme family protein [Paraburkholderia megapolitana]|uniref:iron-containing redox enzyme family protein n=1 Tax=Paraburkholderia megapolitana TaxID=420953 RepID=UPI0038B7C35E